MESLPDSLGDRLIQEVLPPPFLPLSRKMLYSDDKINLENVKDYLIREGKLGKKELLDIINQSISVFKLEPNILNIKDPVTIVGDIHGQFYDLISLLSLGGDFKDTQYLFLGDYVDRGSFSVEVIILLICAKLAYKDNVYLLRGNHECRQLTSYFNFKQECEIKYDLEIYEAFMILFDNLPIGCVINEKFLVVHGGIGPDLDVIYFNLDGEIKKF